MMMRRALLITVLILVGSMLAAAQGNGFSFQGRLNNGTNPANGSYDLQFKLYDAVMGGNQIGTMVDRPNTVLVNGVFSVTLDFGASAFNNPASIFIEIAVRPNGSPNAYTILGPRQQLTVVPYAVRATNATNADLATNAVHATNADLAANATNAVTANHSASTDIATFAYDATNAVNATNATTATNSLSLGGVTASNYARLNFANPGSLQVTNEINAGGNVRQPVNSNGLVKAMLFVDANGSIIRCYNGITNTSEGNCGFTISYFPSIAEYDVHLGFPLIDRYIAVTPLLTTGVNIVASFAIDNVSQTKVNVYTRITDVTWIDSFAANPFMLIVY
jgi:hypothetical protein